jgi:hypothetical protein
MNTPTFTELFMAHAGRVSSKWVHYLEVYERYFVPYRAKPCKILEIGVQNGGSLQLYQKYFPFAQKIVGVDIDPKSKSVESGNIFIETGSQFDRAFLISVNNKHGPFDIVIDDGSHVFKHQRASFETLFPLASAYSVYIVEDTHTSYLPDFEGGIKKDDTFIEYAKFVLDHVNAPFFPEVDPKTTWLTHHIYSASFYDSMVVFEKRPKTTPFVLAVGTDGHRPVQNFQDLAYFRKRRSMQ